MRAAQWVWGSLFLAAGGLVASPLADGAATGPRIGLVMVCLTLGLLIIGIPLSTWIIRKTTRPADYQGSCPVGQSCPACEAFNLYPRDTCRVCKAALPSNT